MKIVVTGGLGYIGSSLLEQLHARGCDRVLVIDNLSAGYHGSGSIPPVDLVEADIRTLALDAVLSKADAVIHLAAATDVEANGIQSDLVNDVNVCGTRRVAEACLRVRARLLFISTTSVYGSLNSFVAEDCPDEAIRPQSPYAASKWRAEAMLELLGRRGLRYMIARFGSVFGPSVNIRLNTAVNRFCWQASRGEPVEVWRTARYQRRPYLHIHDAVRLILFALAHDLFDNRVYNLVTVNATVHEILQTIEQEVPNLKVDYVDSPIMNSLSYAVRADRIGQKGFIPEGDLSAGIRATLAAFSTSSVYGGLRHSGTFGVR